MARGLTLSWASAVLVASCLCGCATRPARIVCITPCVNEPFFVQVKQGAQDAAKAMGVRCEFVGTPAVDVPAQVQLVRQAIRSSCDGIAINVVDPHAFDAVLNEAQARGIPVVAFNVNGQPHSKLPTVAQDLYRAGQVAAAAAEPMIPEGSRVLVTGHEGGPMSVDQRYRGLFDGLQSRKLRYVWVATSGDVRQVEQAVARKLREDPDIRVIIASGLSNTEGTGRAIEHHFPPDRYEVIGFDTSPEVERLIRGGVVSFTVDQQAYAQGFYSVMQLALARKAGVPPTSMDVGVRVIRKADLR